MNKNLPKVSVLMTVYNGGAYLEESIRSVINQTFKNWELILVDNCSTDNSKKIISKFKNAKIRKFFLKENIGRIKALRFAFSKARGQYIAILDADDIAYKDRFSKQLKLLNKNKNIGLVASYVQFIDGSGKVFKEFKPPHQAHKLLAELSWTNPIIHSSMMYRNSLAKKIGGYLLSYQWGHDFALTLHIARYSKICIIPEFLTKLRVIPTSMSKSSKYELRIAQETIKLFKLSMNLFKFKGSEKIKNSRALSIARVKLGIAYFHKNYKTKGLLIILYEIITKPSILFLNGPVRRFMGANY